MIPAALRALLESVSVSALEGLADGMDSGEYVADPAPYHAELLRPAIMALRALPALLDVVEAAIAMVEPYPRTMSERDAILRRRVAQDELKFALAKLGSK